MNKIELIKALIKKETDPKELERLQDELINAIEEDAREKAAKKIAADTAKKEAEAEEVKLKEAKAQSHEAGGQIKVISGPGEYKGFKLRAEAANLGLSLRNEKMRKFYAANPDRAERMAKFWIDLVDTAIKSPSPFTKSINEGTTTAGGYLTPQEQRMELLAYGREESIALADCQHIPMTSDSMLVNKENAKASVAFTDEATDATETNPTFDQVTITAKRMDGYVKISNEVMEDAQVTGGLVGRLMEQFMEAVGQKIDSTVFVGAGSPMSGVFKNSGYSLVLATGSAAFSMLVAANFLAAEAKIAEPDARNAKYYVSRSVLLNYIYGINDTTGRPIFRNSEITGYEDSINGYPVRRVAQAPATSAASTGFVVFGDLMGVIIGDRLTNISLFYDPYSLSRSYMSQFLLFTRWGFASALPNKLCRIVTAA